MAKLTTRQKQSRRASRSKAKKKRLKALRFRVMMFFVACAVFFLGGGGWWLVESGWVEETQQALTDDFYAMTADAGLKVEVVSTQGLEKTNQAQLIDVLGVDIGAPILEVSLDALRERVVSMSTVHEASVERVLPNTIHVQLYERMPMAIWQRDVSGQQLFSVVDGDGVVLDAEDPENYPWLLVVVGDGAPQEAPALMRLMQKEPELMESVVAAVRVGNRRWNVKFYGGVQVMLPEEQVEDAWQKLAEMEREQGILQKSIQAIDMRVAERIFIKHAPDAPEEGAGVNTAAKDA